MMSPSQKTLLKIKEKYRNHDYLDPNENLKLKLKSF